MASKKKQYRPDRHKPGKRPGPHYMGSGMRVPEAPAHKRKSRKSDANPFGKRN